MARSKFRFYAVKSGRRGDEIVHDWDECKKQSQGHGGSKHKGFNIREEAQAWLDGSPGPVKPTGSGVATASSSTSTVQDVSDNKGKKRKVSDIEDGGESEDVVYSDGTGKGAGIGVWWGPEDPRNLAERCPGEQETNRAELIAILRILEMAPPSDRALCIKTGSTYGSNCAEYHPIWRRNNWTRSDGKPVKNLPLVKYLEAHIDARKCRGQRVRVTQIGHIGIEVQGNKGAGALANLGAKMPVVEDPDWCRLEKELRDRTTAECSASEVEGRPTKVTKTDLRTWVITAKPKSTAKPLSQKCLSASQDLAAYAAGVLDDADLLAEVSIPASEALQDFAEYSADCVLNDEDLLAELSS